MRDQCRRDFSTVDVLELALYIADSHSSCVKRQDLVVKTLKPGLSFLYYLRFEVPVAVSGNTKSNVSLVRYYSLLRVAVAAILATPAGALILLVAEMIVHLSLQAALYQCLGQLPQQTVFCQ
ncbi:MAG: hypothetical protein BWY75_01924 [bacterium ADurb.Bin425]|nr:MAG: hypothetical protein BWY75_01924 [bacterium ADurb.Bin425]